MCDLYLRTAFIYREDYHKLLKTARPQRLAFQKQCPRSINIKYSRRFACNTHTHRQTDKLSTITLRLHTQVNYEWALPCCTLSLDFEYIASSTSLGLLGKTSGNC